MRRQTVRFSTKKVNYYFDAPFKEIKNLFEKEKIIIITDENVYRYHAKKFNGFNVITIPAGEAHKHQQTVDNIINRLLHLQADKQTCIVGVGGGVVTDISGYIASIYKRGIKLALVPTSVLAMVDAAIGGKNGVDVGLYKNMVGTVYQPDILLFDYSFLKTLPPEEWINGFAEIIKHACIKDAALFTFLAANKIEKFKKDKTELAKLIEKNVAIKIAVVKNDEFETGERKLLNFGHTIGHAIENIYHLPHGHAVSVGMAAACTISEKINNFYPEEKSMILDILIQYQLPVKMDIDANKIWEVLLLDKKRDTDKMSFILLDRIGKAKIKSISLKQLKTLIEESL